MNVVGQGANRDAAEKIAIDIEEDGFSGIRFGIGHEVSNRTAQ